MISTDISTSPPPQSAWQVLLRMRWLLGAAIALAFAVGQLVETVVVPARQLLLLDVVGWGLLGGLAVWLSLTWASRQERRYQTDLARALRAEQQLNTQLQRANSQLSLLSEVNRQIADSATLDEVLDAALAFPQRLTPASVTVLLLYDSSGAIVTRVVGAHTDELAHLRDQYDLADEPDQRHARQRTARHDPEGQRGACLVLPLHDGMTAVGRIELYLERARFIPEDELALLETIASEIAEAIVSARRRAREERALYELERAIAEERARIARDIHDGIAQALAFRRMRIDLWLDWLESDRPRLREELIALKQLLREQIVELRRAIFALRPVQFDELGFVGGLHRYVVEFASQQGWDIHVDLSDIPAGLTPDIEAACFRVVQEALTNSAKHARATRVDVTIDQVDQGLRVRAHDNGRGFEPGQQAGGASEQVGLRQMRERLAAIGGQMTVLSQPGAGTEVRVWIPLNSSRSARWARSEG